MFQTVDKSGEGKLGSKDVFRSLRMLGVKAKKSDVANLFSSLDNEQVNFDQFKKFVNDVKQGPLRSR